MLPKMIVIEGTNASGKSSLGVHLAARFGGEIISADSRQVFSRLEPNIARGDAVLIGRVRDGCHGKPAGGVAGGGNVLLRQICHEVQVNAFPGHDGRRFRP